MTDSSNKKSENYYPSHYDLKQWLPTTAKEVRLREWDYLDVIIFSGDAYVDHPAFGAAVIGRALENLGLKVAIVAQPNWKDDLRDFKKLGKPRLFFGVTSGNMDSMINHYTAGKRLRSTDAYTPGNQAGFRPDRATSVYATVLRQLYPDSLIVAGGIEASLRRFTHYDYWDDELKPGILHDRNIDIVVYGMGESSIRKIALQVLSGKNKDQLCDIPQICYLANPENSGHQKILSESAKLASFEQCTKDKKAYARNFALIEKFSNSLKAPYISQVTGLSTIIATPPEKIPDTQELDSFYSYPYTRLPHPKYWKKPLIPAFEMIRFSVNIHRGCFGGCSFCTISTHQGKFVQSRSEASVLKEVEEVTSMPGFSGYLSDLGGPSANMYNMAGIDLAICETCSRPSCVYPKICSNLNTSHQSLINLYRKARSVPGMKKVFVGSGVRYDLFMDPSAQKDPSCREYPEELIRYHVSGRLKVAPEHTHDHVLKIMRKPGFESFRKFKSLFDRINEKYKLNQQLIPYFISAHPGCTMADMAELAIETKDLNFKLQQVQDLTPTPMTLAAVMFYTGLNPYTLNPVTTVRDLEQKKLQSQFFFWYKKETQHSIKQTLIRIKRKDLIRKLLG